MAKFSAKNTIILINGYNFSSYATAYEATETVGNVDVTGFTDECKNFVPGLRECKVTADILWDSSANSVHAALASMPNGNITLIPEGYTLGNSTLSLPYMQANYGAKGTPDSAIQVGTLNFEARGSFEGLERGYILAHESVTATSTGTGFQVNASPVTARCAGTLHIWTPSATDTHVVKIQHCTTLNGVYADLVTFTINGSARAVERVAVASGTINQFIRVLETKTGGSQAIGYSVHFWQSV